MSNTYAESLAELKPLLPRGYQKKIFENLNKGKGNQPVVTEQNIKNAFNGREVKEEKLSKILYEAQRLVRVREMKKEKAKNATKSLINKAKLVACYFFVF